MKRPRLPSSTCEGHADVRHKCHNMFCFCWKCWQTSRIFRGLLHFWAVSLTQIILLKETMLKTEIKAFFPSQHRLFKPCSCFIKQHGLFMWSSRLNDCQPGFVWEQFCVVFSLLDSGENHQRDQPEFLERVLFCSVDVLEKDIVMLHLVIGSHPHWKSPKSPVQLYANERNFLRHGYKDDLGLLNNVACLFFYVHVKSRVLHDVHILYCITGTRWHHSPPQTTWVQRKDVAVIVQKLHLWGKWETSC